MSWRLRSSVETILRLTPVVLGEDTLDDRPDESAAPALQSDGRVGRYAPSRVRR